MIRENNGCVYLRKFGTSNELKTFVFIRDNGLYCLNRVGHCNMCAILQHNGKEGYDVWRYIEVRL